jgi:hypothetical protein
MQLVILIYHVTGASQSLPIYMHIRALVSSYIFLNAYGHFFFVWSRENTSLERYLQVRRRGDRLSFTFLFVLIVSRCLGYVSNELSDDSPVLGDGTRLSGLLLRAAHLVLVHGPVRRHGNATKGLK